MIVTLGVHRTDILRDWLRLEIAAQLQTHHRAHATCLALVLLLDNPRRLRSPQECEERLHRHLSSEASRRESFLRDAARLPLRPELVQRLCGDCLPAPSVESESKAYVAGRLQRLADRPHIADGSMPPVYLGHCAAYRNCRSAVDSATMRRRIVEEFRVMSPDVFAAHPLRGFFERPPAPSSDLSYVPKTIAGADGATRTIAFQIDHVLPAQWTPVSVGNDKRRMDDTDRTPAAPTTRGTTSCCIGRSTRASGDACRKPSTRTLRAWHRARCGASRRSSLPSGDVAPCERPRRPSSATKWPTTTDLRTRPTLG